MLPPVSNTPMHITLRPAQAGDFDFCARLFLEALEWIIVEMNLDREMQLPTLRKSWLAKEVSIITEDGADIGWLQITSRADAVYVSQIFVAPAQQGRGIGRKMLEQVIDEAGAAGKAVALSVLNTNPAVRLYKRLGFYVLHEAEGYYLMRRAPGVATPLANLRG
jgi:ribosomal protein S18 acetylase RimI-like enzyme